eukprot:318543_1
MGNKPNNKANPYINDDLKQAQNDFSLQKNREFESKHKIQKKTENNTQTNTKCHGKMIMKHSKSFEQCHDPFTIPYHPMPHPTRRKHNGQLSILYHTGSNVYFHPNFQYMSYHDNAIRSIHDSSTYQAHTGSLVKYHKQNTYEYYHSHSLENYHSSSLQPCHPNNAKYMAYHYSSTKFVHSSQGGTEFSKSWVTKSAFEDFGSLSQRKIEK